MHAPALKLERGWCVVDNWTLFMHVMTRDGNDELVNIYHKQKTYGNSTWLINICLLPRFHNAQREVKNYPWQLSQLQCNKLGQSITIMFKV